MDTIDQNTGEGLHISTSISTFLTTASKWAKFLAIVGFVFLGLMVLGGFMLLFSGASIPGNAAPTALMGVIYLAMGALYFFPALYLYNFADKMKKALLSNSQEELESSFENLKSLFKFTGILTIVVISLYIIMIIGFIFVVASLGAAMHF